MVFLGLDQTDELALVAIFLVFLILVPTLIRADMSYSIPVIGRYSTLTIGLQIPSTPKWAHDVVVNASKVWTQGQLWFQQSLLLTSNVYSFIESKIGGVIVSFNMPKAYAGFAVGWTEYRFAASSKTSIVSARVFLHHDIFNSTQAGNATANQYAFRIALHELGRVLGLGSILDGQDIMDPRQPASAATQQPLLSTLDLYAVHVLASGNTVPSFVTLPCTIRYELLRASTLLSPQVDQNPSTLDMPSHEGTAITVVDWQAPLYASAHPLTLAAFVLFLILSWRLRHLSKY